VASFPASVQRNPKNAMASPYFWVVVALLVVIALLHYLTPQTRLLSRPVNAFLSRHAVERIVFVLPVVVATHAFRWRGGVFTLVLAVLAMLPRAIWLSPSPGDALIETAAAAAVGSLALWTVEAQARQKVLHQRTASRLSAISAITAIVTRTLDLDQILSAALDKILEVMGLEAGLIFLLEGQSQELLLAVYRGVSEESAAELGQLGLGADVHSGELMAVQNAFQQSPAMQREGLQTQAVVPLRSRERFQGAGSGAVHSHRQRNRRGYRERTAV
jgi:hypothetical protein